MLRLSQRRIVVCIVDPTLVAPPHECFCEQCACVCIMICLHVSCRRARGVGPLQFPSLTCFVSVLCHLTLFSPHFWWLHTFLVIPKRLASSSCPYIFVPILLLHTFLSSPFTFFSCTFGT